jgi:hypothetical protein
MQHVGVELLRVLKKREMAHLRFDEKPATGDMVSHEQRIVALDRLVMISPGGHLNAGKIIPSPMWLRFPHFGDLSEEGIVFGRGGREFLIFRFRARDECGEDGTLIDVLDAAIGGIGARTGRGSESIQIRF